MKTTRKILIFYLVTLAIARSAQTGPGKKVVITGARFTYPLVEKWIGEYKKANPSVDIVIEPRTTVDPSQYDLLIEAYEKERPARDDREYLYLGRYAVVPVANALSRFAKVYGDKGLTKEVIRQVFFHDIYTSKEEKVDITERYTVYTRLQKAGAPTTFASYFGFEQQQIQGKSIAGSDEHLVRALLKDSTGVSYNTLGLLYDLETRAVRPGLLILPVDADDNGRVSREEKFYDNLDAALSRLEEEKTRNIPIEYLHFSLKKHGYNPEALKFLLWVIHNSQEDLHTFGFLKPEQKRFDAEKEKFEQLASSK